MRLKDDIVLGNIDGNDFAIATGKLAKSFKGIINNNSTAAYMLKLLKTEKSEDSIVEAMMKKYDGSESEIRADVKEVIDKLNGMGILQ